MTGVTRALLAEYESNSYATYPIGYYKAITLSGDEQSRVLEIICEITGLTEEQLEDLPDDYFPAITGTIISFDAMTVDENGDLTTIMENIIGEEGSKNSTEMMITYFGMLEMTYEEAYAEYNKTIEKDKVTGGFDTSE